MDKSEHINRFGERHISIPRGQTNIPLTYEDELGMTREEVIEELDWSHDPRSESAHESHTQVARLPVITDELITHHAYVALSLSPDLGKRHIEIEVKNGQVYLDGFVPSRRNKRAAEYCVERLSGVADVFNRLNIN